MCSLYGNQMEHKWSTRFRKSPSLLLNMELDDMLSQAAQANVALHQRQRFSMRRLRASFYAYNASNIIAFAVNKG
jgi:hypothetical protein